MIPALVYLDFVNFVTLIIILLEICSVIAKLLLAENYFFKS